MGAFVEFVLDGANLFATMALLTLALALTMGTMRDLRILALVSGLFAALHFAVRQPDSVAFVWVIILLIANGVQLGLLLARSRTGLMRDEERRLIEDVLKVQDPKQQRRLLDLVKWRDLEEGHVLIEQGQSRPPLVFIASGQASVQYDGVQVGVAEESDFLGEMSLVSGARASAGVVALSPMRIARIERDGILRLTSAIPELSAAFDHALNIGMAAKIARMNEAAAGEGE